MPSTNRIAFHGATDSSVVLRYTGPRGTLVENGCAALATAAASPTPPAERRNQPEGSSACSQQPAPPLRDHAEADAEFRQIMSNLDALLEIARGRSPKSSTHELSTWQPPNRWVY